MEKGREGGSTRIYHLTYSQVVTIRALPFVYAEPMDADSEECDIEVGKIPCPQHNSTGM